MPPAGDGPARSRGSPDMLRPADRTAVRADRDAAGSSRGEAAAARWGNDQLLHAAGGAATKSPVSRAANAFAPNRRSARRLETAVERRHAATAARSGIATEGAGAGIPTAEP